MGGETVAEVGDLKIDKVNGAMAAEVRALMVDMWVMQ